MSTNPISKHTLWVVTQLFQIAWFFSGATWVIVISLHHMDNQNSLVWIGMRYYQSFYSVLLKICQAEFCILYNLGQCLYCSFCLKDNLNSVSSRFYNIPFPKKPSATSTNFSEIMLLFFLWNIICLSTNSNNCTSIPRTYSHVAIK